MLLAGKIGGHMTEYQVNWMLTNLKKMFYGKLLRWLQNFESCKQSVRLKHLCRCINYYKTMNGGKDCLFGTVKY